MIFNFGKIWPGDRKWIMLDMCSEKSEIADLDYSTADLYKKISDRIAQWSCDLGLPCISIFKDTTNPNKIELISNCIMAPFGEITDVSLPSIKNYIYNVIEKRMSCGWYCSLDDLQKYEAGNLHKIISNENYKILIYGPVRGNVIKDFIAHITHRENIWIITDGIRKKPDNVNYICFSQIEAAFNGV